MAHWIVNWHYVDGSITWCDDEHCAVDHHGLEMALHLLRCDLMTSWFVAHGAGGES